MYVLRFIGDDVDGEANVFAYSDLVYLIACDVSQYTNQLVMSALETAYNSLCGRPRGKRVLRDEYIIAASRNLRGATRQERFKKETQFRQLETRVLRKAKVGKGGGGGATRRGGSSRRNPVIRDGKQYDSAQVATGACFQFNGPTGCRHTGESCKFNHTCLKCGAAGHAIMNGTG